MRNGKLCNMSASNINITLPSNKSQNSVNKFNTNETNGEYVSEFYLKLYEQALQSHTNIDHQILQLRSDAVTVDAIVSGKVHGDILDQEVNLPSTIQEGHEVIMKNKSKIEKEHKHFYKKLLGQDSLLQMQEERRIKAHVEIEEHQSAAESKRIKAEQLLQEGIKVHQDTLQTKETVKSYKAYKDYVERSVPLWGREATTVDAVCGRFRDLLNLRYQLMSQVEKAFLELQKSREFHQKLVKSEKIQEGRALLQVYRHRSSKWESERKAETSKNQLRNLRNTSTGIATRLTRVRLALANMYSVARRFQSSLPPLQPNTVSTEILKRLHNFLLDASRVAKLAKMEQSSDSLKASKGSII